MLTDSFKLFFLLILLANFVAGIGVFFLKKYQVYFKNTSLYFFSALTIGVLCLVISTSIIVTNFRTVNVIIILILIYFFYMYSVKNSKLFDKTHYNLINNKTIFHLFLELNISILIIFTLFWLLYSYNKNMFIGLPGADFYFYSRLSDNFLNYHTETNAFSFYQSNFVAPYHYFDIWFNTFVSLFNSNCLTSFIFITIPIFAVCCYFGFKSIVSDFFTLNKYATVLLAISGFLLSGVYLSALYDNNFIMNSSNVFSRNVLNYQKLFPLYMFLIWAIYFLKHKKIESFFAALGVICVCYISSVVVVFVFCVLFLIYYLLKKDFKKIYASCITLCVIFLLFCFYYFLTDKNELRLKQVQDFSSFLNITKIKTGINIFFKTNIQFVFLYFFNILIFFFNYKKNVAILVKYKFQIVVIFSFYVIALLSWVIFNHVFDSVQLFSNLTVPLLNIISLLFICYNLKTITDNCIKILFLFFLGFILFMNVKFTLKEINPNSTFSEKSLMDFRERILPKLTNKKIAYLKSKQYLNNIFAKSGDYGILSPQLLLLDNFEYISLSVFDSPISINTIEKEIDEKILLSSFFYKYVQRKNSTEFKDLDTLKLSFIKDYKIQLIITGDKAVLPDNIKNLVIDSVSDFTANEKYFLLNIQVK